MVQILPGITKIGCVSCSMLQPSIPIKALAGVPISVLTDIHWLEIQGDATCVAEETYINKGRKETTTLNFHTACDLPSIRRLAFVVVDADSSMWLIGAAEGPYPVVEKTKNLGSSGGTRAGIDVKVTYTNLKSLVCISK